MSRQPNARLERRLSTFSWLTIIVMVLFLAAVGTFFYWQSLAKNLPKKGILAEDQLFPSTDTDAYKNLDLKIAAKAHYDSNPIQKLKNLGVENNVATYTFSFRVGADNLTEYGLMTQPTTPKPPGGYPVIILCHGYATPRVYSTAVYYKSDMVEYSKAGFIVIKPDFRGQGLSLNVGKPEGAYYSMAYNTDIMSLIAAVKETNYMDKSRINLWGHSMGAYIALRAAVLSPDIKNLILLSGPVGTVQDMYKTYIPVSDRNNPIANDIKQAVLLRYGNPLTNPTFWNSTSPLSYLNKLKARVQIYVGSEDQIVPPKFSADLNRVLNRAHIPHQYFIYPLGSHGLIDERPQIYDNTLQLLTGKTT